MADGRRLRARAQMEVVAQEEMTELVREEHKQRGHYKHNMIKLELLDEYTGCRWTR